MINEAGTCHQERTLAVYIKELTRSMCSDLAGILLEVHCKKIIAHWNKFYQNLKLEVT